MKYPAFKTWHKTLIKRGYLYGKCAPFSKKTAATIISSGNNYAIGVKRNQGNLYKKIEQIIPLLM